MHRKFTVYFALFCIIASLVLVLYFFARKPEPAKPRPPDTAAAEAIVFRDVHYTGEKKGVVDWELTAKTAKKYIKKPLIELENLNGHYKPKDGTIVNFTGTKGSMDTDTEKGNVENVEVIYKDEYKLKSPDMFFDFKSGITFTKAPVDITGPKLTMKGIGLTANTNEETIRLEKDVSGIVATKSNKYRFEADHLVYDLKHSSYILEGTVKFKGEDMDMSCNRLLIFTTDEDLQRVEAYGAVRVAARGSIAKNEKAVYHFKEGKIASPGPSSKVKGMNWR